MTRRYTYATCLSWGGDTPTAEVEVEVSFSVAWGSPETGRFGPPEDYDPGCGDAVEDIRLETVEGKARPWGMYSGYVANEDDEFEKDILEKLEAHEADMLRAAGEEEAANEDAHREAAWEEARDMDRVFGPAMGDD